jgi:hypothetical protein
VIVEWVLHRCSIQVFFILVSRMVLGDVTHGLVLLHVTNFMVTYGRVARKDKLRDKECNGVLWFVY